jgi:hypothetical protein
MFASFSLRQTPVSALDQRESIKMQCFFVQKIQALTALEFREFWGWPEASKPHSFCSILPVMAWRDPAPNDRASATEYPLFLRVFRGSGHSRYAIIHATNSVKKHTPPALALPDSNFPATPAIPATLEIEPANSVAAADTRRANQKAPFGTALAANGRCGKNWNFVHVDQQLGTRHHLPIPQDDKENP